MHLADAQVSGCNLFALRTAKAAGAVRLWRDVEDVRKRPFAMAWRLGPMALARYATRALSLEGAEAAISRASAARCRLVILDAPEAAHDVDKPEDLAFAERWLSG